MQHIDHLPSRHRYASRPSDSTLLWLGLGLGALAGAGAYAWYEQSRRNPVRRRPPDSAPGRTARQGRFGDFAVTGRTVTIGKPRHELYAFWRDFRNLPQFMENVRGVTVDGDLTRWTIGGPRGPRGHRRDPDRRRSARARRSPGARPRAPRSTPRAR